MAAGQRLEIDVIDLDQPLSSRPVLKPQRPARGSRRTIFFERAATRHHGDCAGDALALAAPPWWWRRGRRAVEGRPPARVLLRGRRSHGRPRKALSFRQGRERAEASGLLAAECWPRPYPVRSTDGQPAVRDASICT
eukprot:scaffold351_cov371-Prasinococcus_capsulatus_cf.AAC.15